MAAGSIADDVAELGYRSAVAGDVPALLALVNGAYRGESSRRGWTTEADLLDGTRTDAEELAGFIADPDHELWLCQHRDHLLGCVHLARDGDAAYLGMFTVHPDWQGRGIGSAFLTAAEARARALFGVRVMRMEVISLRDELIAFYRRRGYRPTGRYSAFPSAPRYGIPKVAGLRLLCLEKRLAD